MQAAQNGDPLILLRVSEVTQGVANEDLLTGLETHECVDRLRESDLSVEVAKA